MTWRVARSLDTLLGQLNAVAPRRSKLSDGAIGDAAHATRDSDHNPWVQYGGQGIVTARDYTHDPAGGLGCNVLAAALVLSRDPRIKYVIWNRRIFTPGRGWQPYTGINPHTKHLHLSVSFSPGLFDSTAPWALLGLTTTEEDDLMSALDEPITKPDGSTTTLRQVIAWSDANIDATRTLIREQAAAVVNGLLDAEINRDDLGRGPTSLRQILRWSDNHIDALLAAATAGQDIKAAVEGLSLRLVVA